MTISARILVLVLPLTFCLSKSPSVAQGPKTAAQIVTRMAKVYATCASYDDTGVVVTTWYSSDGTRVTQKPFKTWFVRPDLFRFEWKEENAGRPERSRQGPSVVWSDGKKAYNSYPMDGYAVEENESLGMAIAGATGISSGSAHTISRLLIAHEVGGFGLEELTDLTQVGEATFEGTPCYLIRGKHPAGDTIELWIGKQDLLLRKMRTQTAFDDFSTIDETIYRDVRVGGSIPSATFHYSPPKELTERAREK
jgi:outer membrane lipoprotein-sorting protein